MAEKQMTPASVQQIQLTRLAKADAPEKQQPVEVVAAIRRNSPAVPVRKPLFRN